MLGILHLHILLFSSQAQVLHVLIFLFLLAHLRHVQPNLACDLKFALLDQIDELDWLTLLVKQLIADEVPLLEVVVQFDQVRLTVFRKKRNAFEEIYQFP